MLRKKLGTLALAAISFATLAVPTAALARDRDDNRYRGNDRYGWSDHNRRDYREQMREREKARKRWEREMRQRQRYNNRSYNNRSDRAPYGNSNGYYDRYGYFHPYR